MYNAIKRRLGFLKGLQTREKNLPREFLAGVGRTAKEIGWRTRLYPSLTLDAVDRPYGRGAGGEGERACELKVRP